MAGCFEFRMRTSSFDLHTLATHNKLSKLGKLFRSRSDTNVKTGSHGHTNGHLLTNSPKSSPAESPRGSPGAPPRRRFMRVVRDGNSSGEEYENPHLLRKISQEYAQNMYLKKSQSLDDNSRSGSPMPYEPVDQESSILKWQNSNEESQEGRMSDNDEQHRDSPTRYLEKHASFQEEVEIIEFDKKEKIKSRACFMHRGKLQSDDEFDEDSDASSSCDIKRDQEVPEACPDPDSPDTVEINDSLQFDLDLPTVDEQSELNTAVNTRSNHNTNLNDKHDKLHPHLETERQNSNESNCSSVFLSDSELFSDCDFPCKKSKLDSLRKGSSTSSEESELVDTDIANKIGSELQISGSPNAVTLTRIGVES